MKPATPEPKRADLTALPAAVRLTVQADLQPEERVLWAGRPVAGAAWGDMMPGTTTSRWARVVMFTIVAGVALYALAIVTVLGLGALVETVQRDDFGPARWPVLILMTLVLLWLVYQLGIRLIYPLVSVRLARKRSYVLTNRRAVVACVTPDGVRMQQIDLGVVEAPRLLRLRRDGVGDIIFDGQLVEELGIDGSSSSYALFDSGFTACPAAEQVIALFSEARERRRENYERELIREMSEDYQGWLRRNPRP